ncbi:MAG: SAM-dependent chlorinase/fluorinase [Candidatus Riflebacteria bacterium]|nr:SAM-dependent chlorinase/fluorinase [Candidatus Riflebacteria bacterium]
MKHSLIVTLLTDFGISDIFVGVMKGVILRVNPKLSVIDLTHQIPPQDISAGSFALLGAYRYFPRGTVHVGVVDPGVGTNRRAIAIRITEGYLVGPDNGIFTEILFHSPAIEAVELTESRFFATPNPSKTFHGRDIFASVAAYLACGTNIHKMGPLIHPSTLIQLPLSMPIEEPDGWRGIVRAIDRFGNLITNISGKLMEKQSWEVSLNSKILPIVGTYSCRVPGDEMALIGSHGNLEIALCQGNAQLHFESRVGDDVFLKRKHS